MDVIYRLPKENGGASAEGCVRYDQEQELTDEQQQQVRENIGALPEVKTINITGLENTNLIQFSQEDLEEMGITAELMEAAMAGKVLIRVTCDAEDMETNVINMEPFAIPEEMGEFYALKGDSSRITISWQMGQAGFFTIFFYVAKDMSVGYALDNYYDPQIPEYCVSYGESQILSNSQKLIACNNIGAAQSKTFSFSKKISEITKSEFDAIVDAISSGKQVSVRCEYQEWNNYYIDHFFVIKYGKFVIYNGSAPAGSTDKCIYLLKDGRTLIELNTSYLYTGVGYSETTIPYNPSNKTITIKQGGTTKGSFTLDQLTDKTINLDAGGVQSDWNETDTDDPAFIKNKPTIPTVNNPAITINQGGTTKGSFTLNQSGAATINLDAGGEPVQSDWNETDGTDPAFIKNKPTIPQPENHQLLKSALSEAMGCQANTWHTLCEVTVPEDGAYQVSASVRAQPSTESTYSAVSACIEICEEGEDPTECQEIQLPRSGEYGTMAVPVEALRGQKIRLRAYSSSNFYAQAAPSAGKASATFIAAVRIGAIYQE